MTAQRTSFKNAYETTLTAECGPNDLTYFVAATGGLTSPCYIVFEMDSATQREYVEVDGTIDGTSFTSSGIGKRYLDGSAAGSNLTHPVGTKVYFAPSKQHFDDIHDRIDGLDHGSSLAGLGDDDHPQYSLADGSRAFTGVVAGVTPTAPAELATKGYVDGISSSIPPGAIAMYGAAAAPSGYLLCDGDEISRASYAGLFAVIGTNYGIGDGSTTFDLPDLRQRFPLGLAASGTGSTLGDTGGSIDPTIDLSHAHTVDAHDHDIAHSHAIGSLATSSAGSHTHTMPSHDHTINHNHASFTSGGGTSHTHAGGSHNHFVSDTSSGPSSLVVTDNGTPLQAASGSHTHTISDTSSSNSGTTGTESTHTHAVDVPNFNGTSGSKDPGDTNSDGAHTHPITGTVADAAGTTGNASPGTDTVGSATAAVPNAPFLSVQYIIKT